MESPAQQAERRLTEALREMKRYQWKRAKKALGQAIELAPDDVRYEIHLARVEYYEGRGNTTVMAEALDHFESCRARDPEQTIVYEYMGTICWELDRAEEAKRWWTICLEKDPANELVKQRLRKLRAGDSRLRKGAAWAIGKLIGRSY